VKAQWFQGRPNEAGAEMERVISSLEMLRRYGQKLGPYLVLEILLPGGTLFALLLFLYRRRKVDSGSDAPRILVAFARALVGIFEQIFVLQPCYIRPPQAVHAPVHAGVARSLHQ
jgi:hypothetical protein